MSVYIVGEEGWQRKEASCPFSGQEAFSITRETNRAIWDMTRQVAKI